MSILVRASQRTPFSSGRGVISVADSEDSDMDSEVMENSVSSKINDKQESLSENTVDEDSILYEIQEVCRRNKFMCQVPYYTQKLKTVALF